ncbi:MAG: polysaccharide deacetylase family protein [Clostridia bacterium]|nr:polysaccharide deacetylase family protein [Clostridia bacterium]
MNNQPKKKKLGVLLIILLLLLLAAGLAAVSLLGNIRITLRGAQEMQLEYGTPYEEPGADAVYSGMLGQENREIPVTITGQDAVDHTKLGTYEVRYQAEWGIRSHTVIRKVHVVDTTAPVIQLVGDPTKYTLPGQKYQEEGFTATDNHDGDLTAKVQRTDNGHTVTYTVTDTSGNTTTVTRTIVYKDPEAPVITLKGSASMSMEVGAAFTEPGYTASDNVDGDLTAKVKVSGTVNTAKAGTYVLTYTVTDAYGNTATAKRTVTVKKPADTVKPVITLKGNASMSLTVGATFTEPGYTASDNVDGDLTAKVKVSGTVNTAKAGTYVLTYTVTDAYGNTATAKRTVTVKKPADTVKPVITLKGNASMSLTVGATFTEPGYTASDNVDGNLTSKVKVSGTVNTAKAGTYSVSYTVTDAAGNKTVVYRKVVVSDGTTTPTGKVIYLTFDDGPGAHTERLLTILKKYNAKATFFVVNTGYSAEYKNRVMKQMVTDGHAIAIHSATHNFAQIYANEDAYFKDLYKMQDLIREATGVNTMLLRFPGGSSNTVSKKYNKGIMTRLTKEVQNRGFVYFDWNVDSYDAGGATTAAAVYNNVVKGCKSSKAPIVLMHDIKKYTVDAIEDILKWGQANGYTFAALNENSPTCHHGVNN